MHLELQALRETDTKDNQNKAILLPCLFSTSALNILNLSNALDLFLLDKYNHIGSNHM
jgi:hypothetical protein